MKKILIYLSIFVLITSTLWGYTSKKIVVNVSKQMAYAYEGKKLIYSGWASTGRKKFKTPTGYYTILKKEKEHISNEWPKPDGGAKMPYMLRITWTGIALHSGYTPNRPASHGCVRLDKALAKKLFNWARVGTKVVIKGKLPKHVTRKKGSRFIAYKSLKKSKYKIANRYKKTKKVNKYNIIAYKYSKYSYKHINRLISTIAKKKNSIISSKRLSRYRKIKMLKAIKKEVSILKNAKNIKYKRFRKRAHKKLAYKVNKVKKVPLNSYSSAISFTIKSAKISKSFGHLATL